MILLVDIGNTLIKFAISTGVTENIRILTTIETKSANWETKTQEILKNIKDNLKDSIISSVVPEKGKVIFKLIKNYFKIDSIVIDSTLLSSLPLKFNLNNQQIGSDFLALAIGADNFYGDCIVVSLGTATTYSVIKNNELIGVIIGPGFTSAKNALVTDAALIKSFNLEPEESVLGTTTNHALSIGFGNSFNYMISSTVDAINHELNTKLPVILTGNAHNELAPFLTFEYQYNRELLMIGLIIIYQSLMKNNKIKS